MLDTRLSSIFELILHQAAWTPSARVPLSALELSLSSSLDDRPRIFDS